MADVTVAFEGWNSSTHGWGEGPWGEGVAVPGATGAVGSVTISADANTFLSPVLPPQALLAQLRLSADANVAVTGISATERSRKSLPLPPMQYVCYRRFCHRSGWTRYGIG